ncbi:hypothetical protein BU24DRAFT_351291 [Aaosphaeria arxii CBS 175.79]|uniref:Oxidase cueO n=1 Tax=Aaosphaeria arxii CBS 175.79 TaxID=1450172 RepID=A0A6A5XMB7_9PLEO|nr:uncharacterized protein BU24DRAFT_351291 [Aaosphaeria arxii CBS 175.79]KAF2013474.1 hypothetical protein BU24DRAFT_351291 [Aaosphaeria arxii CBS 175.79]
MFDIRSFALAFLLASPSLAAEDQWLSPEYQDIFQHPLPIPPVKAPKTSYKNETTGQVIDYYEIEVKEFEQQVYPGLQPAKLIGYDGMSPGPTFRVEKGRESVVRFINRSPNDFSVHLHGSYSRAPFDGWAEDVTKPGQYKDYYYPNKQSARTLWYHDHAVRHTAENAYFGQAGFYLLHDAAEDSLNLPSGNYDIPLAISAKQYNQDGTLFSPKDERFSLYGDVIHVNGQPWPYLEVEPRKYRLRLLDTSISRAFNLYFEVDDDAGEKIPFEIIAADAGLMTKSVQSEELAISMAERWEIIFDFSAYAGKNITLRNSRRVQADEDYKSTDKVMRFVVGQSATSDQNNGELPTSLRTVPFPPNKNSVDRSFRFDFRNGVWQVNGVTFADINNRILAKPKRGQVEVWEFSTGGGWSHPVHVHLVDFQVLSRSGGRGDVLPYEKEALKDVVLVGQRETVRVIARFAPWDGVYMFHCHNLVHEDHDMMVAFNISSLGDWGYSEKTSFIDPMDKAYRSKDVNDADFQESAIQDRLNDYYLLDAYKDPEKVEAALESYWAAGGAS